MTVEWSDSRLGPVVPVTDACRVDTVEVEASGDGRVTVSCYPPFMGLLFGLRSFNEPGEIEIVGLDTQTALSQRSSRSFDASECSLPGTDRMCVKADLDIVVYNIQPLYIVFRGLTPKARLKLELYWESVPDEIRAAIEKIDVRFHR